MVAAHPFRWEQPFDEILRTEQPELDGMELFTSHMDTECRRLAAAVHRRHRLGESAPVMPTKKRCWVSVTRSSTRRSAQHATWWRPFRTIGLCPTLRVCEKMATGNWLIDDILRFMQTPPGASPHFWHGSKAGSSRYNLRCGNKADFLCRLGFPA